MALQILLFACIGVAMEVVFTAATEFPKNRSLRLMGWSYIWMFPIYGCIPLFLAALYPSVSPWHLAARLTLYVALIYVMEYATGWLLRKTTGRCPWDYGRARWAVHGLIRLDYAPSWALAAFIYERLWLILRVL